MKRIVKKAHRVRKTDGTTIVRQKSGRTVLQSLDGREKILTSPVVELSEAEVEANINALEATQEEIEAGRKARLEQESEWWGRKGAEVPFEIKNGLNAKVSKPEVHKMVEALEVVKEEDEKPIERCHECGGEKFGRGFKHVEGCPLKRTR